MTRPVPPGTAPSAQSPHSPLEPAPRPRATPPESCSVSVTPRPPPWTESPRKPPGSASRGPRSSPPRTPDACDPISLLQRGSRCTANAPHAPRCAPGTHPPPSPCPHSPQALPETRPSPARHRGQIRQPAPGSPQKAHHTNPPVRADRQTPPPHARTQRSHQPRPPPVFQLPHRHLT